MEVHALSKQSPYGRISNGFPSCLSVFEWFVVVIVDRVFPLCMISISSL